MREIDKILDRIEHCITHQDYEPVETEVIELKPTPPNLAGAKSILESICAFMNTNGGILILGIKDNNKNKTYELTGYQENAENMIKAFGTQFTDKDGRQIDLSEYIVDYKIRDFSEKKICIVYIDKLPHDQKYAFFNRKAYKRILTGDHEIDESAIARHEEFKAEIRNARELTIEKEATLADIDLGKLSDYIYLLNREVMTESPKNDIESAKSFLARKKFIIGEQVTTLGLLVCGKNVKDFLGWRSQVDGFVDIPFEVAQDKKQLIDNVIPLMERSLAYILKNIQVGVTVNKSGSSKPEYPERLLRETINNAIAHRDYSIDKYININIKPDAYIEIRNPGSFKKQLLIEVIDHEIPIRRIIPDSKPRNPKLADVLKVFDKWEGASRGMSNLVNEALSNKIDMPYYRFYNEHDLGIFIPKGKLVDDAFISLLNSFDLFIATRLNGATLKDEEIAVLAYFYKSEKANEQYRHTILLSPDNNHFSAIRRLAQSGLIIKHPATVLPSNIPLFVLNRVLMREDYIDELRQIFGGRFDELPEINKQVLSLIYQFNHYNKNHSISATQAGRLLFDRTEKITNSSAFDNFKRKIYTIFKKLVASDFLKAQDNKNYFINTDFKREPSIFDK
jgi:ATP-dependent DNA helicase RecG